MRSLPFLAASVSMILLALSLDSCGPLTTLHNPNLVDMAPYVIDQNADNDHDGFTPKMGDCDDNDPTTHPGAVELCLKTPGDGGVIEYKDHNCNGIYNDFCDDDNDGYNVCPNGDSRCTPPVPGDAKNGLPGGDCDDTNPFVNPGAYEIYNNGLDDDCSPATRDDSKTPYPACDSNLKAADATAFANAIDLCAPWLVSAAFEPSMDKLQRKITNHFGSYYKPQFGDDMIILSTGVAGDLKDGSNYQRPGTQFSAGGAVNPLQVASHNVCFPKQGPSMSGAEVYDLASLTLTIKVPTNAKGFSFESNFFSAEYWESVGGAFNDEYIVKLTSKKNNGVPIDICTDKSGDPITVDAEDLFAVCWPQPTCSLIQGSMNTNGNNCPLGPKPPGVGMDKLLGTGFDQLLNGEQYGGATDWLTTTTGSVVPGETITLEFFIFDAADPNIDSLVLIDHFQWLFDKVMEGTIPG